MSSALKLISLETANMGRPRFYYKSFHKKAIIIIQEIITTLRWLLSFCMNLNTVQKKNIKQVLHIVNREISRLFYPSILFYCDK